VKSFQGETFLALVFYCFSIEFDQSIHYSDIKLILELIDQETEDIDENLLIYFFRLLSVSPKQSS